MSKTITAAAILFGMIVGVGIFGLPYVMAKAGFGIGLFWLAILGAASLLVNIFYGEVVSSVGARHRLVGYTEIYLGKFWKFFAAVINVLSFWGAQLAYIIVGGKFLSLLLSRVFSWQEDWYILIFCVLMSALVVGGLKTVKGSELAMSGLIVAIVLFIALWSAPRLEWHNFLSLDLKLFFFPYGVTLFALTGAAAIPEMHDFLRGNKICLKQAIWLGSLASFVLTFIFVFSIIGLTGGKTSPEALAGLVQIPGSELILVLGVIFGLLAIATSFLVLGLNLHGIFHYDYHLSKNLSWLLVIGVPAGLFLIGAKNFIQVIDFCGSIFSSLSGLLMVGLFLKVFSLKKSSLKSFFWPMAASLVCLAFMAGLLSRVFGF